MRRAASPVIRACAGFDLAVTQHTPVYAANDGKVLLASMLGIYGNCIVIDHGFGLQSIYGHLADFAVKPGDVVKKGQEIGKSDSTGMALSVSIEQSSRRTSACHKERASSQRASITSSPKRMFSATEKRFATSARYA